MNDLEIETDIKITVTATGVEGGEDVSATDITPAEYRGAENIKVFFGKIDVTSEIYPHDMSVIEDLLQDEIYERS
tara:strand:+ start:45 stop:269 length:225 start_codon:yes stop_codon:yes gene_type:complete